jgi:hypothetical protein
LLLSFLFSFFSFTLNGQNPNKRYHFTPPQKKVQRKLFGWLTGYCTRKSIPLSLAHDIEWDVSGFHDELEKLRKSIEKITKLGRRMEVFGKKHD